MTVMWVSPWRPFVPPEFDAQMLRQPHQDRPHQERLVRVVADVLDLEHHVAAAEPREVQFVAALEKAAGVPSRRLLSRTLMKPCTSAATSVP